MTMYYLGDNFKGVAVGVGGWGVVVLLGVEICMQIFLGENLKQRDVGGR